MTIGHFPIIPLLNYTVIKILEPQHDRVIISKTVFSPGVLKRDCNALLYTGGL